MNDQQQLVNAIFNKNSDFEKKGLAIYRRNLQANAVRALQISYPTVLKLIGDELFAYAAERLLKMDPPNTGDWGMWGEGFPEQLRELSALSEFPYVIDIAQLDFLMHTLGREQDVNVELSSMALLAEFELDQLKLVLNPGIKIFKSDYPVLDIYQANNQAEGAGKYLEQAKKNLENGIGQNSLVYRPHFKPVIRILDSTELHWLRLLQQGKTIGQALDELLTQDKTFSLEHWLPLAVEQNLILKLKARNKV